VTEILHVARAAEWRAAADGYVYAPSAFADEGFVHCCTPEQLDYVLDTHFRDERDLVLLTIEPTSLSSRIEWEPRPGPEGPFPHVYGPLDVRAVVEVATLPDER
jgi:uncharacterized protein (DUF952 family)